MFDRTDGTIVDLDELGDLQIYLAARARDMALVSLKMGWRRSDFAA